MKKLVTIKNQLINVSASTFNKLPVYEYYSNKFEWFNPIKRPASAGLSGISDH